MMKNVPLTTNSECIQEQQIVYGSMPVNYTPINNQQSILYPQQLPNNQIVNQYSSNNLPAQHHQHQHQIPVYASIPSPVAQQSIHSNMNKPQVLSSSYQPLMNTTVPLIPSMTNPGVASTPVLVQTKRGRNDISGNSESNVQSRPLFPQTTRIFNSSNTPNKRHRGTNQHYSRQYAQNAPGQLNQGVLTTGDMNQQQPSLAARKFAATRFPFSPFTAIFTQEVREKIVVEDLIKHALHNYNFEVKTIAYRKGRAENNECRILIFVEDSDSFAFLYNQDNWPTTLAGNSFTRKSPSLPPQLALVLPSVSLQVEWDDFVQELKDNYPGIANIIRLKNKAQQPVRAVKLEFLSSKARSETLEAGEVAVLHMKLKVVEYYSQANVLICSNCYGIGHFRKNCPQKEVSTCKTCGEKCQNMKDHQCTGVLKCIHCGGSHISNDPKCRVVKDYRAALTRNLLSKVTSTNGEDGRSRPTLVNTPFASSGAGHLQYATVAQMVPPNMNDMLMKKLDSILEKVEEESNATRRSLEELKEEMKSKYEETKKQVDMLETKVNSWEKKFEDLSKRICTIMQNVCTSFLDPQVAQSESWKTYWREQIQTLAVFRSSSLNSHNE
jgi:hypothetical protein